MEGDDVPVLEELSCEQADTIANEVINCIKRNGFAPVTVTVVDNNAEIIV